MPATLETVVEMAMELPVALREIVAHQLLQSIDENYEPPMDPEIEAAWDAEIKRRIAEIDAGTAVLIPADEVFARMRAKYPDTRPAEPDSRMPVS